MEKDICIYELPEIAKHYPSSQISMLPLLNAKSIGLINRQQCYSRFLEGDSNFVPSGRVALYHALKLSQVNAGDEVLLPAYHCGSMIEPVIYIGAKPVFYNLANNLTYKLDDLVSLVSKSTKAVILPHFFGFPQKAGLLKEYCDSVGIKLIEDCAHSFLGFPDKPKLGSVGHFSIASTVKFFPGTQGGALVSNNRESRSVSPLNTPGLVSELKSLKHTLEISKTFKERQKKLVFSFDSKNQLNEQISTSDYECITNEKRVMSNQNFQWFDPKEVSAANTFFNIFIIKHSRYQKIVETRRSNFHYYLNRIKEIENIKPLHADIDGVVPYVFPVILADAERYFPQLKLKGVPIWRWEELALTGCNISEQYRHSLLQLPCHQSISKNDIDWIIDQFKSVLSM